MIGGARVSKDSSATSWKIKEGQIYHYKDDTSKEKQQDIRGKVYKVAGETDLYCVISEDMKLDSSAFKSYSQAIQKGIVYRKTGQSGIKMVGDGGVYELKMYGVQSDDRPYTNKIFVNEDGKCLIFFDKVGNHKTVAREVAQHKQITKTFVEKGVQPDLDKNLPEMASNDYNYYHPLDDYPEEVEITGAIGTLII